MQINTSNHWHMKRMMEFLALPKRAFEDETEIEKVLNSAGIAEIETPEENKTCNTCDIGYKLKNNINQNKARYMAKCRACKRGNRQTGMRDNWAIIIEDMGPVCSVCQDQRSGLRFHESTGYVCEQCYVTQRRCRCGSGQPVVKDSGMVKCRDCHLGSPLNLSELASGTSCALDWD